MAKQVVAPDDPYEIERWVRRAQENVRTTQGAIATYGQVKIAEIAATAIAEINRQTAKTVVELLEEIINNTEAARDELPGAMDRASAAGKAAALAKLESAVAKGPGRYREGQDRVSGGRLVKAVEQWSFIPNARGIRLLTKSKMTRAAAQWGRMNFGVISGKGPNRATGVQTTYQIKLSNVSLGEIGITGQPGPPMLAPPGPWMARNNRQMQPSVSRRGSDRLMFKSPRATKSGTRKKDERGKRAKFVRTSGIKTIDYLGAGTEAMVNALEGELNRMMGEITKTKGRPSTSVTIKLGQHGPAL